MNTIRWKNKSPNNILVYRLQFIWRPCTIKKICLMCICYGARSPKYILAINASFDFVAIKWTWNCSIKDTADRRSWCGLLIAEKMFSFWTLKILWFLKQSICDYIYIYISCSLNCNNIKRCVYCWYIFWRPCPITYTHIAYLFFIVHGLQIYIRGF